MSAEGSAATVDTTRAEDARMALLVLGEVRMTLAQAKGYIREVSREREDLAGVIVTGIEERLSEVDALRERFRRVR